MSIPVRFDNVSKSFKTGESATALRDLIPSLVRRLRGADPDARKLFWALRDVSFEVAEGEVLGFVGRNGAGKSTTLKLVAGILRQNKGTVEVNGSLSALIEVGAGFHPDLTGRENIFMNGAVLGLSRRDIRARFDDIVAFAELEEFIDTPVKRYSSGMYMRLGFAVAVHVDPAILLIDEVLAVGDLAFRRKCLERVKLLRAAGKTILFVSHKMNDVRAICDRVMYVKDGLIHREGTALDVTREFEADMKRRSALEITGAPLSQRTDNAAVRVMHVEARDSSGAPVTELHSGQSLIIHAAIESDIELLDPILSVALLRSDNLRACCATTRVLGPRIPRVRGACTFEVEFDDLDLMDDFYAIETIVWNAEMNVPLAQHLNPTIRFIDERPPVNRPGVFHPAARFGAIEHGPDLES